MTYRVVVLAEGDWAILRGIRLQALAESPTAFGSTLADEQAFPEKRWRDRASGKDGARFFVALAGDVPVGVAGVFDEGDGSAQMVSVWVNPDHRGRGVARQLMSAALRFAGERGFATIRLWVTDGNAAARNLYVSLGFTLTGNRQPMPWDPSVDEHELYLALSAIVDAGVPEC